MTDLIFVPYLIIKSVFFTVPMSGLILTFFFFFTEISVINADQTEKALMLNLKKFLQEQKLHSKTEAWAILRSSSFISDPDMIW